MGFGAETRSSDLGYRLADLHSVAALYQQATRTAMADLQPVTGVTVGFDHNGIAGSRQERAEFVDVVDDGDDPTRNGAEHGCPVAEEVVEIQRERPPEARPKDPDPQQVDGVSLGR